MSASSDDPRIYAALMIPAEALERGGVEILRAGLVDDALNVHALRAFDDPGTWGAVLAEIAERIAGSYMAEGHKDALALIRAAFVAEAGAPAAPVRKTVRAAAKPPRRQASTGRRSAGPATKPKTKRKR